MNLTIYADKPEYKKNDTINYTITQSPKQHSI